MHGAQLQSVYLAAPTKDDFSPRREESEPQPQPAPPKTLPRSTVPEPKPKPATVSRPVTVGVLREAKAAAVAAATTQRVPITQRNTEPEVPARLQLRKKTVAFGVTTNVSQTVEREKDPQPPRANSRPPAPPPRMSLARAGLGAERGGPRANPTATRQSIAPPLGAARERDENRHPGGGEERDRDRESRREERKDTIAALEARIAELERTERKQRESQAELQRGFDRVVKIVSTLTERVAELEVERERGAGGGGGGRERERERSIGENGNSRPRRRLYSSEEEENGGRREQQRGGGGGMRTGGGLLSDKEAVRAIDRQMSSNPLLRRTLEDAIEEDRYEQEYGGRGGGGGRRTTSPPQRRGYFDEYSSEPRAAAGRSGGASTSNQRWKEESREPRRERARVPSPGGRRATGGVTRTRVDITPSRRRVTERVTMERVHHFDESDDSDERYSDDPQYHQTQYSEEILESADFESPFESAIQPAGRTAYGRQPARRDNQRGGVPLITEMSESEDEIDRKRREIQEMKEAKARRG